MKTIHIQDIILSRDRSFTRISGFLRGISWLLIAGAIAAAALILYLGSKTGKIRESFFLAVFAGVIIFSASLFPRFFAWRVSRRLSDSKGMRVMVAEGRVIGKHTRRTRYGADVGDVIVEHCILCEIEKHSIANLQIEQTIEIVAGAVTYSKLREKDEVYIVIINNKAGGDCMFDKRKYALSQELTAALSSEIDYQI